MPPIRPALLLVAAALHGTALVAQRPAAPAASTATTTPRAPLARTEHGLVAGTRVGPRRDVAVFRGIPYAAPPTGPNRWRPPQPPAAWRGTRRAVAFGRDCMQLPLPGDAGSSGAPRGEDCLTLNVWRPVAPAADERGHPVLVWIHGGGFLNGAASVPMFDGAAFARRGIVVVSMNYRLGRLGFFAHPALTREQAAPTANFGLLDQRAALAWVRRNARAFGGDSAQVTVVGESAGGIAIVQLLTDPATHGLFDRAVVLSGGGRAWGVRTRRLHEATTLPDGTTLPSAQASGVAFGAELGVRDTTPAGLAALRARSANRITGMMSMADLVLQPDSWADGIVIDGTVVRDLPGPAFEAGTVARVPLLIGTTGDDLPGEPAVRKDEPLAFFGPDAAAARAAYRTDDTKALARAVGADATMHEPARFVARRLAALGAPTWRYRFDYVAESQRPRVAHAPHAGELAFLFDNTAIRFGRAATARDRAAAALLHGYVANFVRTGDPNGAGLPAWPRAGGDDDPLLEFRPGGTVSAGSDPWRERLDLIERARRRGAGAPP